MRGLNSRLEQEKGIRLAVRIGIHTGLVVVGEIGKGASQEHLALGETPNIASRIEGMAERNTVAISAATYQLVQGYFVCDDLGQHALKGVHEPQQVYWVAKESDVQSRFDVAAVRRLTPLVGRESETTLLFERWEHAKEGQGDDPPEARLGPLEQMLSRYQLETEETVPLFASLLSLPLPEDRYPPLNLSPQRQRQRTLETIAAMLLQQSEQQPVLFILEDLHWADPTTLDLLDLLIDQTPTTSILTLLTCRPTLQPTWTARSR